MKSLFYKIHHPTQIRNKWNKLKLDLNCGNRLRKKVKMTRKLTKIKITFGHKTKMIQMSHLVMNSIKQNKKMFLIPQ